MCCYIKRKIATVTFNCKEKTSVTDKQRHTHLLIPSTLLQCSLIHCLVCALCVCVCEKSNTYQLFPHYFHKNSFNVTITECSHLFLSLSWSRLNKMNLQLMRLFLSTVSLITLVAAQYQGYPPTTGHRVRTSYGEVVGTVQSIGDGKVINQFIGIPYAASPVRANRFRVINFFLPSLSLSWAIFVFTGY